MAGGVGAMVGAAAAYWWTSGSDATSRRARGRFVLSAPPAPPLQLSPFTDVAISPDGERVVYACDRAGSRSLYLRSIEETSGRFLPGSDVYNPFFSPDGVDVGYYRFPDQALVRASSVGGAASTIATGVGVLNGACWSPRGDVVFSTRLPLGGLMRIPESGGEPESLTTPAAGQSHAMPDVLPGGRAALFTILPLERGSEPPKIALADLETGGYRVLLQGSSPRFASTGHVVFVLEDRLMAVELDVARGRPVGAPRTILRGVATSPRGIGQFGFSRSGALILAVEGSSESRDVVWVDREANEERLDLPPRGYSYPRVAPDGRRVAVNARDARGNDIFVWEPGREVLTRLTSASHVSIYPTWSPDGRRIAFWSDQPPTPGLYWTSVDGASEAELWAEAAELRALYFFTPSGDELVLARQSSGGVQLCKRARHDAEPVVLLEDARNAVLSPGGDRIAYQSDADGRFDVYVRSFPSFEAGYHRVSSRGGIQPLFSPTGEELFFVEPGSPARLMSAPLDADPASAPGRPRVLMNWPYFTGELGRTYDVARPGGERFVAVAPGAHPGGGPRVEIVLDGFAVLT